MDVAVERFAQQGYAATSVREIASRVGVNSAMVHYYFGSKLSLLQQVLEQSLEPLASAIAGMKSRKKAPVDEIVRTLLSAFGEHPDLPVLIAREVILPGGVMREHFMAYLAPRLGGALPELLVHEREEGRLRGDLDTGITALILISLCAFPFISRSMAEPALEVAYDEQGLALLERHLTDLLESGFAQ